MNRTHVDLIPICLVGFLGCGLGNSELPKAPSSANWITVSPDKIIGIVEIADRRAVLPKPIVAEVLAAIRQAKPKEVRQFDGDQRAMKLPPPTVAYCVLQDSEGSKHIIEFCSPNLIVTDDDTGGFLQIDKALFDEILGELNKLVIENGAPNSDEQ